MKKRNVLLFGAGAALEWKAPTTAEITQIVLDSGFKITDSETRITEYIYNKLKENNYTDKEITFETIINVLEELVVFYSAFDGQRKIPSIISCFFSPTFEYDILNFSVEGGEAKHGFKLEIPKGRKSEFAKHAINFETPQQFFLELLLAEIITNIAAQVSKYSYHTKGYTKIITEENSSLNCLFNSWITTINKNGILRMYTLNYDRLFKTILENGKNSMSIFEGFDSDRTIEYYSSIVPNIPRILTDTQSNICYNLHGSAFWEVESRNDGDLPNPSFYLTEAPYFMSNSSELPIWQSEKGKTILITNIITGYQKTQRGILAPFRQMASAFDRDCCFADFIYIIGYSFNDEHINASLRIAIEYNRNVKIIIVDPSFTKDEFDLNVAIKIFSNAGEFSEFRPKTIQKDLHSFFNGKFLAYTKTFRQYMNDNIRL